MIPFPQYYEKCVTLIKNLVLEFNEELYKSIDAAQNDWNCIE